MAIIMHQKREYGPVIRWAIGAPVVWLMIVPVVISDVFITLYMHIAFPIYGIQKVRRSDYIRISDRAKLPYLTWYEKAGCAYCGYVNGWLHYASVIAGRTENYFCAISHLEDRGYVQSDFEKSFAKYGDEAALKRRYARYLADAGGDIT